MLKIEVQQALSPRQQQIVEAVIEYGRSASDALAEKVGVKRNCLNVHICNMRTRLQSMGADIRFDAYKDRPSRRSVLGPMGVYFFTDNDIRALTK